jgi:CRP-like cAMP-binding protein
MDRREELNRLIAASGLFAGATGEGAQALAAAFAETQYPAGFTIFQRGEAGSFLLLVAEGRVRLSITGEDGRELSVRHAAAGECLGEIAVLDGGERTADAVAIQPVRGYVLGAQKLLHLMAEHPVLATGALRFLCRRLRATTDQLEGIALHTIEQRLARFLLVSLDGRTAPPGKRVPLDMGFSQSELAQLLGASRPKVNVALGTLEQAGAVKRTADRIFCDPALLARIAGETDGA